jgi:hypothetical protein
MIFEMRGRHRNLKAISGLRAWGAMPVSQSTSRGHIANEQPRINTSLGDSSHPAAVGCGRDRQVTAKSGHYPILVSVQSRQSKHAGSPVDWLISPLRRHTSYEIIYCLRSRDHQTFKACIRTESYL